MYAFQKHSSSYLAQYWFDGKLDKFAVNNYAASAQIY